MRTTALIAGTVAAVALAGITLRRADPPGYDGPVAVRAATAVPSPSPISSSSSRTPTSSSPTQSGTPGPRGVDWSAVVADLDAARTAAFAHPAAADPLDWSDASCACLVADRRALDELTAAGVAVAASAPRVVSVAARPTGPLVEVTVTDELAAYSVVDAAGRVVRRWPGRGPARWHGVLVRTSAGWRWRELARSEDHDPARGVDPRSSG